MKTMTKAEATAMKKDLASIVSRWLTAGVCADEAMRDAAIAEYRAYVDLLSLLGVSVAHVEQAAA